jgi:hypothetical protein
MIHIFFVPGMFGSTVEYVLRSFTKEYVPSKGSVAADGSMHTFSKEFHPYNQALVSELELKQLCSNSIITAIYPFLDTHLLEIISAIKHGVLDYANDRVVLIHAANLHGAELNILFQYHKVAFGNLLKLGLEIFCGNNQHDIINWNPAYTHWSEMKHWELREWFSLFYVKWVQEWINSQNQVESTVLKIDHQNVLNNFQSSLETIINHCGLTQTAGLKEFSKEWVSKQQYIVDEFNLLDQITQCTLQNQLLSWQPINIIAEAIVQQRIRAAGYEIRCDGLNTFPTDSKTLYNLLEKV